jgi:diguanylate cyclase (GGDEF)-like protein
LLLLVGFDHTFSLLISGVLTLCMILALNGAQRVEWSKAIFAFSPAIIILIYTLLELSMAGLTNQVIYVLARQGLCLALLIPVIIYGFEGRQKVAGVLGVCVLAFLVFDIVSLRLGAFQTGIITGINHGLFSVLSVLQFVGLAVCVLYVQSYTMKYEQQVRLSNEKLQSQVVKDGMTGLYNHTFMEQLIGDAINRSKRSKTPLSLLMIDVDFFKHINDTFGHNAGDVVLIRLAQVLNSSKRTTDYLGRWGGDELVLLLNDTNLPGAARLAEKLRSLVESHIFPRGSHLTISLGASEYHDGDTLTSFLGRADAAMYHAKHGGRNRVEIQDYIDSLVPDGINQTISIRD